MQRVGVYCGSSSRVNSGYLELAYETGRALASSHLGLVYGGGGMGLMGEVARGVVEGGREVIGVTIRMFDEIRDRPPNITELHVVETMHERKALMAELSDGFVALPGGLGTFDELVEVLTWAQLGMHEKPVGLLNYSGYFDPFLALLDYVRQEGFLYTDKEQLLLQDESPAALIERMKGFTPRVDLEERWRAQTGG